MYSYYALTTIYYAIALLMRSKPLVIHRTRDISKPLIYNILNISLY